MYTKIELSDENICLRVFQRGQTQIGLKRLARDFKFRYNDVGGLNFLCNENKGANQPLSHRAADVHIDFRITRLNYSHLLQLC